MISHHCDNQDNNDQVFDCFQRFVQTYIDAELVPKLEGLQQEGLLVAMCRVWEDYTIYAKMMDRCFDYLNRYYLCNSSKPPIGTHCQSLFKAQIFLKHK